MPNGAEKNWIRLLAAVDGYWQRYGAWPTHVVLPEVCLADLRDHILSTDDFVRLRSVITLEVEEDRFAATDGADRAYDYMSEGFPEIRPNVSAIDWLRMTPRPEIY